MINTEDLCDAQGVADNANAVAKALIAEAIQLDAPAEPLIDLTVVEDAGVPTTPASPKLLTNLLIGLVVGLAVGIALAIARGLLDTRIHSLRDLQRAPSIATLTGIPRSRRGPGARLEGFRLLRAHLLLGTEFGHSAAVASASAATDTHRFAAELASAFSEVGRSVVVVDARLSAARADGLGLVDVIENRVDLDEALQSGTGFSVLGAGNADPQSAQALGSDGMRKVLAQLLDRFELVLVACPPLTIDSSATVVAASLDSTLVVVESGITSVSDYRLALERLADVGVGDINVVLDQVAQRDTKSSRGIPTREMSGEPRSSEPKDGVGTPRVAES